MSLLVTVGPRIRGGKNLVFEDGNKEDRVRGLTSAIRRPSPILRDIVKWTSLILRDVGIEEPPKRRHDVVLTG